MSPPTPAQPSITIVIPAYNEESRLGASLEKIAAFVTSRNWPIELIVVDNNSKDRTGEIADEFCKSHSWARWMRETRQGKGAAVRTGMLAGKGDYLFMCDADLAMPIEEIERFYEPGRFPHDIAIASREHPESRRINEPNNRHIMGRVFNNVVKIAGVRGLNDTQCGFKSYSRAVVNAVFPRQKIDGWAFDVEILFLARKVGFNIIEVPIDWYYQPESKVRPGVDAIKMLIEIGKIRWNLITGKYM